MGDEEDEEEPAVELGSGESVPGAPLGRVASRLSWPRARSDVIEQEGETELRTGDGPRPLAEVMESVETTYFGSEREFVEAVREHIGYGPVATGPTDDN